MQSTFYTVNKAGWCANEALTVEGGGEDMHVLCLDFKLIISQPYVSVFNIIRALLMLHPFW